MTQVKRTCELNKLRRHYQITVLVQFQGVSLIVNIQSRVYDFFFVGDISHIKNLKDILNNE